MQRADHTLTANLADDSEGSFASEFGPIALQCYTDPALNTPDGFRFLNAIAEHYFIVALADHCMTTFGNAEGAYCSLPAADRLWVNSPDGWTEMARALCTPTTTPLIPVLH